MPEVDGSRCAAAARRQKQDKALTHIALDVWKQVGETGKRRGEGERRRGQGVSSAEERAVLQQHVEELTLAILSSKRGARSRLPPSSLLIHNVNR